jgi:hypothetical protein
MYDQHKSRCCYPTIYKRHQEKGEATVSKQDQRVDVTMDTMQGRRVEFTGQEEKGRETRQSDIMCSGATIERQRWALY